MLKNVPTVWITVYVVDAIAFTAIAAVPVTVDVPTVAVVACDPGVDVEIGDEVVVAVAGADVIDVE